MINNEKARLSLYYIRVMREKKKNGKKLSRENSLLMRFVDEVVMMMKMEMMMTMWLESERQEERETVNARIESKWTRGERKLISLFFDDAGSTSWWKKVSFSSETQKTKWEKSKLIHAPSLSSSGSWFCLLCLIWFSSLTSRVLSQLFSCFLLISFRFVSFHFIL